MRDAADEGMRVRCDAPFSAVFSIAKDDCLDVGRLEGNDFKLNLGFPRSAKDFGFPAVLFRSISIHKSHSHHLAHLAGQLYTRHFS